MKIASIVLFLLLPACSSGPKSPPLRIEIPQLGASVDVTGFVESPPSTERVTAMMQSMLEPGGAAGVTRMSATRGLGRVRLEPFPAGSNKLTMAHLEIRNSAHLKGADLAGCVEQSRVRPPATVMWELTEPAYETRGGVPVATWSATANFFSGGGPDMTGRMMVASNATDCITFEAWVNHNFADKVIPNVERAFASLKKP